MTKKELEQTEWAKNFKKGCPTSYKKAIDLVTITVKILHSNELGEWMWAVVAGEDFWLDAFTTKKEAINLCKEMGWRYTIV